jgi:hypothetical protein
LKSSLFNASNIYYRQRIQLGGGPNNFRVEAVAKIHWNVGISHNRTSTFHERSKTRLCQRIMLRCATRSKLENNSQFPISTLGSVLKFLVLAGIIASHKPNRHSIVAISVEDFTQVFNDITL